MAPLRSGPTALELGEEALDDATLTRVVVEALTDDAAGQAGRECADLGPQRGDRLLALRLDLGLAVLDDPSGLDLRLLAHLDHDLGALLARLLADPGRLVPRLAEALLEIGQAGVRLGLLGLGGRDAALDRLGALREGLLEARDDVLLDRR